MAMTSTQPVGTTAEGVRGGRAGGPDRFRQARAPSIAAVPTTFFLSAAEMVAEAPSVTAAPRHATRNDRTGMVARLADSLEQWRRRIDGLLRRSDLSSVDLRDILGDRLAHLEVAWEVAHQRLWVSATTIGQDADSIYQDVEDALADVKVAYAEVAAVLVRR